MDEKLIYEVLSVVEEIPAGRVATYGQIARLIGRPRNARLVGRILSRALIEGSYTELGNLDGFYLGKFYTACFIKRLWWNGCILPHQIAPQRQCNHRKKGRSYNTLGCKRRCTVIAHSKNSGRCAGRHTGHNHAYPQCGLV